MEPRFRKRIIRLIIVVACLLLIPLVAMQFADDVVWTLSDFIAAGVLLLGAGLAYELLVRKSGDTVFRAAVGLAIGSGLFLIWANLAVGIIGNENEPANSMYFGVVAIGILGAVLARFRPRGMALALLAMALAQTLTAVIALIAGMHRYPESSVWQILNVNGFFAFLFTLSAVLFYQAGQVAQSSKGSDHD